MVAPMRTPPMFASPELMRAMKMPAVVNGPAARSLVSGEKAANADAQAIQDNAARKLVTKGKQDPKVTAEDLAANRLPAPRGPIGFVIELFEGVTNKFFTFDFASMLLPGLAGIALTPVSFLGKMLGNQKMANLGENVKGALSAPRQIIEHSTLGDGMSGVAGRAAEGLSAKFGAEHWAARGAATATEKLARVDAGIGRGIAFATKGASTGVGAVLGHRKGLEFVAQHYDVKTAEARGGLAALIERTEGLLAKHGDNLSSYALQAGGNPLRAVADATNPALSASLTGAEHLDVARKSLAKLKDLATGTMTAEERHLAPQALEKLQGAMSAFGTLHKDTEYAGVKAGLKEVNKAVNRVGRAVTPVLGNVANAEFFRDIPGAISALPQRLGHAKLFNAGFNAAIGAQVVSGGYHTYTGLKSQFVALKGMHDDLTGKKSGNLAFVWDMIKGNAPAPVKAGFHQLMLQAGPQVGLEAMMDVLNVNMMRGRLSKLAFPLLIGGSMAGPMFIKEATLAKDYGLLKQAFDGGAQIDATAYGALLAAASPEIAKLGEKNGLVAAVSKEYAAEHLSPTDVMKEVSNGKLDERASRLQNQLEAEGHKPGEEIAEKKDDTKGAAQHAAHANGNEHQLAAVHEVDGKQVLGKHTARLSGKAAEQTPVMAHQDGVTPHAVISHAQDVAQVHGPAMAVGA